MKLCLSFPKQKNSSPFYFSFFKGRVWLCIGYDRGGFKILIGDIWQGMQGEVYLVKEGGCTPAFPSTSILSSSHVLHMQLLKEGFTSVCSLRLCSKIIISIFWSEDAVLGSGHLLNWLLINIINNTEKSLLIDFSQSPGYFSIRLLGLSTYSYRRPSWFQMY